VEKGGIIKEGIPLVLGKSSGDTTEVLLRMAEEKGARVQLAFQAVPPLFSTLNPDGTANFTLRNVEEDLVETYSCDLSGHYQQENISTTLTALALLVEMKWKLPGHAVREGLKEVAAITGLMGRWQTVGANPRSICDTAHNAAGISAVIKQIKQIPWKNLHIIWGMVNDKEIDSILPLLPGEASYYFTPSSVPRTLDSHILQAKAVGHGLTGDVYESVAKAYQAAQEKAAKDDLIFTGGSTFVVADLLESLGY
jgi:dihydrofolate synthase/folylpolyglutamate synthase